MSILSDFLDVLCEGRRLQLSVADVSGILNHAALKLPYKYKIHAKTFCDAAKETKRGYALCVGCKNLCNAKAMREGVPFSGLCPYGLFEAVYPIALRREVVCVVYCGGGVLSPDESREKCRDACAFSGADGEKLCALLPRCASGFDAGFYEKIAAAVGRYIYEICVAEGIRRQGTENDGNWVIREIREYTEHRYFEHLSLRMMARRYFMNEKYLGRLFIKECGTSYASFVNGIRIEEAKRALAESEKPVLDIALSLGYESVNYFNRRFRNAVGLSPTEYRKQEKNRAI